MLKDNVLTYHENDLEGAKSLGTIDIRNAVYVDMVKPSLIIVTPYKHLETRPEAF